MLSLQSYAESAFDEWHVKLLQDVAAHVSLALANADHFAQAQTERARLEALHVLEMGVAGASDERQLSEAVFSVVADYMGSTHTVLAYLDVAGPVAGVPGATGGAATTNCPAGGQKTPLFPRMIWGGQLGLGAAGH